MDEEEESLLDLEPSIGDQPTGKVQMMGEDVKGHSLELEEEGEDDFNNDKKTILAASSPIPPKSGRNEKQLSFFSSC